MPVEIEYTMNVMELLDIIEKSEGDTIHVFIPVPGGRLHAAFIGLALGSRLTGWAVGPNLIERESDGQPGISVHKC